MDEIAGFRARAVFSPRAPADFADARQDVCDRLLLSMMVNSRTGSRLDLEQPAPQRRFDAELRRDRGQAHGAWRLCRSFVESGWADNANWEVIGRHVLALLLVDGPACSTGCRSRATVQDFGSQPLPRIRCPEKQIYFPAARWSVSSSCYSACPKLRSLAFACTFAAAEPSLRCVAGQPAPPPARFARVSFKIRLTARAQRPHCILQPRQP